MQRTKVDQKPKLVSGNLRNHPRPAHELVI